MSDFNYAILEQTAHRPWPMPDAPWVMTQTWHNLLFAHWPVDARALRELVPPGLPLDVYEGQAWIGIVPFRMTNVAPRGVPNIPFVSAFPELNVRTYVTVGGKPGVYFFSLDADSSIAVATARTLVGLPYFNATMHVEVTGGEVRYESKRDTRMGGVAEFRARYRPTGPVSPPVEGSLEYFLTERYCLYRVDDSFHAQRLEIHHPKWPLQVAAATFECNTMADAAGVRLPSTAPLLHYAERQDMVAWAPYRID
jgi:uncharacterized protein YqjF (DUF2071 family)